MSCFHLTIATPEGGRYDGLAQRLTVRTTDGEVTILARHINYVAALGMGPATIVTEDGTERRAAAIGGMLAVTNGEVRLIVSTFEWAEDISEERAKLALARAEQNLQRTDVGEDDRWLFEAARRRALVRLGVVKK